MKRIKVLLALLLSCILITNSMQLINASEMDIHSITMDEVKVILDEFLLINHPDITFGTPEYVEYIVEQLMRVSDPELESHPQCDLILDFASLYLYEVEFYESIESASKNNLEDSSNYESFKDKALATKIK